MKNRLIHGLLANVAVAFSLTAVPVYAGGVHGEIEEMLVTDHVANRQQGEAEAASVGTVLSEQIEHRPMLRPAEVLETVPGMVITQHSGGGKANQYFLRGFNLDHSTDFANYFEGAPVNMVTHGHGQGYSDLNFLTPELIDKLVYKKGPYHASGGDFSSAGSARISYFKQLQTQTLKVSGGEDGYRRALLLGGGESAGGHWVYSVAKMVDDGPWTIPDELERDNIFIKHSRGDAHSGLSISALYFDSTWNGTDQIPQREVDAGNLSRYDSLDDSTGGETHRYQLSMQQWHALSERQRITSTAYVVDYGLELSGNFTYFANDPLLGDQVTQFDDRVLFGGELGYEWDLNAVHALDLGLGLRVDDIRDVGVGKSVNRQIYAMDSRASVEEVAYSAHASVNSQWSEKFATVVGLRYDQFSVEVDDKLNAANDGDEQDQVLSPKLSVRFGPFADTTFFVNFGQGYHSNDARGVVGGGVPLLSESEGYELGLINTSLDGLQLSLVVFKLDLDSELVFVGDDGTTEAKDATTRTGLELSLYYRPTDWLVLDVDYTTSDAEFSEGEFDGDNVPDSIDDVVSAGLSIESGKGYYGGLRLRYFGPRYLTEDGERQSKSTLVVNANVGVELSDAMSLSLEVLNVFDREDDDITYWYESRPTPGAALVEDYHSHPMIPRTLRVSVTYQF
ncbi:TonB-dependent receptor [Spongiibacter taiwanensis]|uniref:TonB-dependent receptor n=1 Tax=Spongiibacter taiwanensis TaxID=1748242 RepID=UPI0020360381|nr:TonB-dependent receptor [Spongiibacter taiwanensis]USA44232.1 TonB-dependent receptor [Spongiibacter taiwanensis]